MTDTLKIHRCENCGRLDAPVNIHAGLCCFCTAKKTHETCYQIHTATMYFLWGVVGLLSVGLIACLMDVIG